MGRKRRRNVEIEEPEEVELDNDVESPSRKKNKKEKHKKKKTKRDSVVDIAVPDAPPVKPLTLKIRFGNKVVTAEASDITSVDNDSINPADMSSNSIRSSDLKQNNEEWGGSDEVLSVGEESYQATLPDDEGLEEGTIIEGEEEEEEEEEVWLEALETGNVDERGYIPQKKDLAAMTARQRAILGSKDVELLELPLSRKRGDAGDEEETQEMLLKKTERNKKRRLQAIKRREKHKAETVQKLLQKQSRKKEDKKFDKTVTGPHLRYVSGYDGNTISLTIGLNYPLPNTTTQLSRPVIPCTICSSPKKYSDSTTKLPLCSLECYNILKNRQTDDNIVSPLTA